MKFNKDKIKEDILDPDMDADVDIVGYDLDVDMDAGQMAEVELVLAEPTKMVDADGSIVLAEPGDIVHIQSESLKRIKRESVDDLEDDGIPKKAVNYKL